MSIRFYEDRGLLTLNVMAKNTSTQLMIELSSSLFVKANNWGFP